MIAWSMNTPKRNLPAGGRDRHPHHSLSAPVGEPDRNCLGMTNESSPVTQAPVTARLTAFPATAEMNQGSAQEATPLLNFYPNVEHTMLPA